MENQNYQKKNVGIKVTDTLVDLPPVAVVYNLTNTMIEDFVYDYLANVKKVDRVEAIRVLADKETDKVILNVYGFISTNSSDVKMNTVHVNSMIKDRMDNTSYKTSGNLQAALGKVSRDTRLAVTKKGQNNPLSVKLDIFKILSLMLSVDPYKHELQITEVRTWKKGASVCTVIKKDKFIDGSDDRSDRYSDLVKKNRY